ncbi:MAG: hypothetical protein LBV74_21025 [Tannerella sp.]|nr:hypothetical protein [Tannerella sp.]
MKKYILFILLTIFFNMSLFAKNQGYYQMTLIDVELNSGDAGDFITEKNKYGIDYSTYEDRLINITLCVHPTHISFTLNNNTDSKIKVVWDEAVISGFDGNSESVFHSGTKYINKEESQVSTTIIKGSKLEDIVAPKNLASWMEKHNRWGHTPMLRWGNRNNGKTITLLLPIETEGSTIDYIFTFECEWMDVKSKTRVINGLEYYREILYNKER